MCGRALVWVSCLVVGCGGGGGETTEEARCDPGAAGPTWLTEGESVSVEVGCQGELSLDGGAFEMPDLPAGASYDPATATLSWTPGLDQAAVWNLEIRVIESGEAGVVLVGVADAYDDPNNVPVVDPSVYTMEYGVPVLFLDPAPTQSDVDEPVTVTYGGRTISGLGQQRGASSLSYPKKSYLLKFESDAQFYDLDRDFVGKRRVVLTSTFDDNAYFRQRLVFELWNALEPSMPITAYSVVVYQDGEYWGLYTITDHPSNHWLEGLGLNGDADLFKAINHDANFRTTDAGGNPKSTMSQGYEKKEGPAGDFASMDALVDFVANSNDATFAAELGGRVELSDYNKWWALVVFTLATDSAGKNSYHYWNGGKWLVAPWDFNASFGQSWETSRLPVDSVPDYGNRNEMWRRSLIDSGLGPELEGVLRDAIGGGVFSDESIEAHVDALVDELDASARRDWRKWGADYASHPRWNARGDLTDYDGELAYVRAWIGARGQAVLDGM